MRKPLTIGKFTASFGLSPSSRRSLYSVTCGGAPTAYSIEKHSLWCLFFDGQALPVGRYARLEDALAAAIRHMQHEKVRALTPGNR